MIYTSRYSNPELKTGNYTVVGITRGAPKFPLRYTLAGNIMEIAPPGYLFNEYNRERFTPPYFQHMDRVGTARIAQILQHYETWASPWCFVATKMSESPESGVIDWCSQNGGSKEQEK